jgi:hypothetical protein
MCLPIQLDYMGCIKLSHSETLAAGGAIPRTNPPFDSQHLPEGVFIAMSHLKLIPGFPI